jgi:hypothetical protein
VDAAPVRATERGVRTLIWSLHHTRPGVARRTLENAQASGQPFVAFELSDNSGPRPLWWLAVPVAFVMVFFCAPLVRPRSLKQLFFT